MKILVPDIRFSTGYRNLKEDEEELLGLVFEFAMQSWPNNWSKDLGNIRELASTLQLDLSNERDHESAG